MKWLWRVKWNVARLLLAAALLYVVLSDTGARMARAQLASLPGFAYADEVAALRAQGRYGEAVVIADAGLADADLDGGERARVESERAKTIAERDGFLRKLTSVGLGAVSGEGDSLEALVGAVGADFFIVGDVRDLVVQGGKQVIDGDGDGVILTLSVVGVITTLAPEIDWVPSLLKAAAKGGMVSRKMGDWLKTTIKAKRTDELVRVFDDVKVVAASASPGGAMRALRHCDEPGEIARVARYLEKAGGEGAFALHVAGKEGVELVKAGDTGLLVKAARKGRAGVAFLRSPAGSRVGRALSRPHVLVGIAKAVWKENGEKLVTRLIDRLDVSAWWLVPVLAGWVVVEVGWVVVEVGWVVGRVGSGKRGAESGARVVG